MTGGLSVPGRRRLWLSLAGVPFAFLTLLVVQGWLAVRAEYLPAGYTVEATVPPTGGGSGEPLRLLLLGDSTAAGVGSPTVEESLGVLVARRAADALGRPVQVTGRAVSGALTGDVAAEQVPGIADAEPDVVVVIVGSNDVTHATSPSTLRADIASLAGAVAEQTDAPLVLGGIPLFGSADALAQPLRSVVDAYASVLRSAQRRGATDADVAFVEIARDASPRFRGVPEAMSSDGFHPGPVGYGFWADAIAPVVVDALS